MTASIALPSGKYDTQRRAGLLEELEAAQDASRRGERWLVDQ